MRRVISKDGGGEPRYFNSLKHNAGVWYQSWRDDTWYIITSVVPGEAVDEYGDVDRGWFHTMRLATQEELTQRSHEQAKWGLLTPDERVSRQMKSLADQFPNLDWGDEPKEVTNDQV